MSATTIPRFLTPEEVSAEVFGGNVAPDRILRLSKSQGLPSHRVGRRRMFVADEVADWVRNRDGDGGAASPAATPVLVSTDTGAVDSAWVAAQLSKFSPEDLRRAAAVFSRLAREANGGAA